MHYEKNERVVILKEFTVCYTFENEFITEKIIKKWNVKKENIEKEIIEKMERYKYFIVKNDEERYVINPYLVRYLRVLKEKKLSLIK